MIDSKDISVVVQGAIDSVNTSLCLKSIRKHLPGSEIILSTWMDSNVENLDYDILVLNEDPGSFPCDKIENSLPNNINRQMVSTTEGLKIASNKYCLKIRTDFMLLSNNFLKIFEEKQYRNKKYSYLQEPIVACSIYSRNPRYTINEFRMPYCISDFFFFGLKNDLEKIFDEKLITDENDLRYFELHPEKVKELFYKDSLCRYMPEQFLTINFFKKYIPELYCEHRDDVNRKAIILSENLIFNNFKLIDRNDLSILSLKQFLFTKGKPENCYSRKDVSLLKKSNEGNWISKLTYLSKIYIQNAFNFKKKISNKNYKKINNLSKINIKNIKQKYISFDIFDTILFRNIDPNWIPMSKTGLYCALLLKDYGINVSESEINELRDSCISEYVNQNVLEQKDREYILDDVVISILKKYLTNNSLINELKNKIVKNEVQREIDCLHVNAEALNLIKKFKKANKKIIATSDMYLKIDDIKSILIHFDLLKYFDNIYVSSEFGYQKFTGNLYKYILNDLDIFPNELLHIGDNKYSDVFMANEFNIESIYYKNIKNIKRKKLISKYFLNQNKINLLIERIFTPYYSKQTNFNDYIKNYFAFDFINFVYAIMLYCYRKNLNNIYFLERDGNIFMEIWQILFEKINIFQGVENKKLNLIKISRKESACFINIKNPYSVIERAKKVNSSEKISIEQILGSFGMSMDYFNIDEQQLIIKNNTDEKFFYKNFDSLFLEKFKKRQQEVLLNKKISEMFSDNIVLCDIGWGGTIQKDVLQYIKNNKMDISCIGCYYGIDERINSINEFVYGYHNAINLWYGYSLIEFLIKAYTNDNTKLLQETYRLNKQSRLKILETCTLFADAVNKNSLLAADIENYTKKRCSSFIKNPAKKFAFLIKNVYFSLDRSKKDKYIHLSPIIKNKKDINKYIENAQYVNASYVLSHRLNRNVKYKLLTKLLPLLPYFVVNSYLTKIKRKIYN